MYYFASDMHLGSGERAESLAREFRVVEWLEQVSADAEAIFIVGDLFDFWYEYKRVVPKGFTRLLGTLSVLCDRGVKIHFFVGNHDLWAYDYLRSECGVELHMAGETFDLYGHRVFVAHGDNLYVKAPFMLRFMNAGFRNGGVRWLFSHLLHPDVALRLGQYWSGQSRKAKDLTHCFLGEGEWLVQYARRKLENDPIDYFVFGHNHCAQVYPLTDSSTAVFLGEWIESPHYAVLEPSGRISLKEWPHDTRKTGNGLSPKTEH